MADVAVLLRTIARMENFHFPAIPKFLARYISNSALATIVLKKTEVVPALLEESYVFRNAENHSLCRYKDYSEEIGNLLREVVGEELGLERGREVVASLENVREETAWIFEELVNIAAVARDETMVQEMFKARRSPGEGREEKEEGRKEKQCRQQGQEEKNKFALSVLRRYVVVFCQPVHSLILSGYIFLDCRVRVKLEGREPDALRRSTVGEQVDFVIREAQVQEQELYHPSTNPL